MKNAITNKNSVDRVNSRMEGKAERISELEHRTIEITQSRQQRKHRLRENMNRASGTCGAIIKEEKFMLSKSQKERKKRKKLKST